MNRPFVSSLFLLLGCISWSSAPRGDTLRIAVASNFAPTLDRIADAFEVDSGHAVIPSPGSTGKLYAQVVNGAPYDAFLAADRERPGRLEREGRIVGGSRMTYAMGVLVLWSPDADLDVDQGAALGSDAWRRLAIANPTLAPYGRAARQTLEHLGLWPALRPRLVVGENIAQAYLFVFSGNAELGFVSLAQTRAQGPGEPGSLWRVPGGFHEPIEQQAVLLVDTPAGRAFMAYLGGAAGRRLVADSGYELPGADAGPGP